MGDSLLTFRSSSWMNRSATESRSPSPPPSTSSPALSKSDSKASFLSIGSLRTETKFALGSMVVTVTVELEVHALIFRFGFLLRGICSPRFKLIQLRGHNRFHPVYQFLSFEYQIKSVLVPASSCALPRLPHHQSIWFIHSGSWVQMVVMRFDAFRVQSFCFCIRARSCQFFLPNSGRRP